jgi:hypothetical protein
MQAGARCLDPCQWTRGGRINNYSLYSRRFQSWDKTITRSTTPVAISVQNQGLAPATPCSCVSCLLPHALQKRIPNQYTSVTIPSWKWRPKYHCSMAANWLKWDCTWFTITLGQEDIPRTSTIILLKVIIVLSIFKILYESKFQLLSVAFKNVVSKSKAEL